MPNLRGYCSCRISESVLSVSVSNPSASARTNSRASCARKRSNGIRSSKLPLSRSISTREGAPMNTKGMSQTQKLRALLKQDGLVVGAGAHDAMTAHIVEQVGFPLCFVTGAGISMTHGYADVGFMGMEEVV